MEYIIVAGKDIEAVITEVNKAIKEGYKPIGNISIEYTGYIMSPRFYQAMTKEIK